MEVPGIDSLFIGATGLGRSINGQTGRSSMNSQRSTTISVNGSGAKGLTLGAAIGATREEAAKAVDKGIQWVVFGQDARVLADGLKRNFDELADF